jgi:Resolvase, N terminal domain
LQGRCPKLACRPVLVGRLRYTGGVSHLLGYALVSTAEQNADLQTDELTAAGCWRVWTDHASGVLDRRPQLDELLAALRRGTPWWCGGWTGSVGHCGI